MLKNNFRNKELFLIMLKGTWYGHHVVKARLVERNVEKACQLRQRYMVWAPCCHGKIGRKKYRKSLSTLAKIHVSED